MDEVKIKSKFLTALLSKLIRSVLRKKLGGDIDLRLNEVLATVVDGQVQVHLDADCKIKQSDITRLLNGLE